MKVVWSENARQAMRNNVTYIAQQFGKRSKMKFLEEVKRAVELLQNLPDIGHLEPLLSECTTQYKSLIINKYNKLVYWENKNQIEIVAFWDTRQELEIQINNLQ